MTSGKMVDEIVWDEGVESVTNDITYTIAPMIIIMKNNNNFFMVRFSPFCTLPDQILAYMA
jgi:hypothetical protein